MLNTAIRRFRLSAKLPAKMQRQVISSNDDNGLPVRATIELEQVRRMRRAVRAAQCPIAQGPG